MRSAPAAAAPAAAAKYSNEWIKGKWFNKNGKRTYEGIGHWKQYSKGWKYVDTLGWYPKNQWQKIDGEWYFFNKEGYMETDTYRQGYYLTSTGAWDNKAKAPGWTKTGSDWYYYVDGQTYLKDGWTKIDGKVYYFKESGRMAAYEFVDGWWVNRNGSQTDPVYYGWHQSNGKYWYGVKDGWYAKNGTFIINGESYTFDKNGYLK